jgi:uracil-DNA glycosylase
MSADLELSESALDAILQNDQSCELARECPMYPLVSPGMPPAGTTFQRIAGQLAGADAKPPERLRALQRLYWQALYSAGDLLISVQVGGEFVQVPVISGHLWGGNSVGPRNPGTAKRVMVVGKHPGHEECAEGRNFIGPSGQLLESTLVEAGLPPNAQYDWYVTNVLKWLDVSEKTNIPAAWIKDCLPLLQQELRLFRPDYILCLGAEATKAVCGQTLSGMAGRVEELTIAIGDEADPDAVHRAQAMAVTHPAAVLRTTEKYPEFLDGIRRFVELTKGGSVTAAGADFDLRYIYSERVLADLVDEILAQPGLKKIAVDAEWHGEHPGEPGAYLRSIQISHKAKFGAVVVLTQQGGKPAFLPGTAAAIRQLARLLDRDDVQIIGHFFSSDLPWCEHYGLKIAHRFRVPLEFERCVGGAYPGGFDTALAAHAADETAEFKLELQCVRHCGAARWDDKLQKWKKAYCKEHKLKDKELEGYGECPDEILFPYGGYDVAWTWMLAEVQTTSGGLLDRDRFQLPSWRGFHTSMLAFPAFLEMGIRGLRVDMERIDNLTDLYLAVRAKLTAKLQEELRWPDFNPGSAFDCREFLFGEQFSGKRDKLTGQMVRIRPEGALSLYLRPLKSTGKRPMPWARVESTGRQNKVNPSTDKEVLGDLAMQQPLAALLRDCKFVMQTLKSVLRPPVGYGDEDEEEGSEQDLPEEEREYPGGLATFVCQDQRVRSAFLQTKETGRASSARPPLQNVSAKREADYKRILNKDYRELLAELTYEHPLRSSITGNDDPTRGELTALVSCDYSGAELLAIAVMSRDERMIEHCMRAGLPENDPNYYDIHSNTAVSAFHLNVKPTKKALKAAGLEKFRNAGKTVIFGKNYRQSAEGMCRKCREEGTDVEIADCQRLSDAIDEMYSRVPIFQDACAARVLQPSYITNAKGRRRRCIPSTDPQVLGELERQFINFPIQSLVADCISEALHWLAHHPDRWRLGYWIVLQMHDAIVLEVPIRSLREVVERIMPECMLDRVSFRACDLDGVPYTSSPEYKFLMETDVYFRWGEKLTLEDCYRLGIPAEYGLAT